MDTIKIGNQEWTKENLNLTDEGLGKDHWKDEKTGEVYYSWEAAMRLAKKVSGFHLPASEEWNELAEDCGGVCKNPKDNYKFKNYENCENLKQLLMVKFAGYYNGKFNIESATYFWTSTESSSSNAYRRYFCTGSYMSSRCEHKYFGFSVRLVKD